MSISAVYKITNLVNGRIYIGSTENFESRVKQHVSLLDKGKHYNKEFQLDYTSQNGEHFEFEILKKCDLLELSYIESNIIKSLISYGINIYNKQINDSSKIKRKFKHLMNNLTDEQKEIMEYRRKRSDIMSRICFEDDYIDIDGNFYNKELIVKKIKPWSYTFDDFKKEERELKQ